MRRRLLHASLLAALLALAAPLARAVEIQGLTLRDGRMLDGDFALRHNGLYLATEVGGSLYRWADILPATLPDAIRDDLRQRLLQRLELAQSLYESDQIVSAAKLFREVWNHQAYLQDADKKRFAYAGIEQKMRGLVHQEGRWQSLAEIKAKEGLYPYQDEWLTPAQIKERRAYEAAFAKARGDDSTAGIVALKAVAQAYPDSPLAPVAEQMVDQLVARATAPAPPPERQVVYRDVEPRTYTPRYSGERSYDSSYRYFYGSYTVRDPYDYYRRYRPYYIYRGGHSHGHGDHDDHDDDHDDHDGDSAADGGSRWSRPIGGNLATRPIGGNLATRPIGQRP